MSCMTNPTRGGSSLRWQRSTQQLALAGFAQDPLTLNATRPATVLITNLEPDHTFMTPETNNDPLHKYTFKVKPPR